MKQSSRKTIQELEAAIKELKVIHRNRQDVIKSMEKENEKVNHSQGEEKKTNSAGFFI